jgi:hypothetical protein
LSSSIFLLLIIISWKKLHWWGFRGILTYW